jgi:Right handed beta helix region/Secretion system C-terminal sorting domain
MKSLFAYCLRISISLTLFCVLLTATPSFAQHDLFGPQSGILPPGLYNVIDDISVEPWTSWTLEPGVELRFYPDTRCDVRGILMAEGTENDSIYFIRHNEERAWDGIDVTNFSYLGLSYAVVTGSDDNGIYCNSSILKLMHSRVSNNSSTSVNGGGIHCYVADYDTIMYSTISDNEGNGYYGYMAALELRESTISSNSGRGVWLSHSHLESNHNLFYQNQNSGIYNGTSSCYFDSCSFISNYGINGGAIDHNGDNTTLNHCIIEYNHSTNNGGVLSSTNNNVSITNCILSSNSADGHGSCFYIDVMQLRNSIIIDNEGDAAIYSYDDGMIPYYNIFYENGVDMLTELPPSPEIHFGEITAVNVNGDSCDPHFNLFMDPLFDPDFEGQYRLLANSPAIDAGDPEEPHDPDSTIADIGIHYFDQSAFVAEQLLKSIPRSFSIIKAYPNPFNSTVRLSYSAPVQAMTSYSVYAVTGQLVESGSLNTRRGLNDFTWSAPRTLTSGMYLVRVESGSQATTARITYLK